MKKSKLSKIPNWAVGAVITIVFILFSVFRAGFLEEVELKTYDLRMNLFSKPNTNDRIAIVAIDSDSIAKLGRWPWSRDKIAAVIDKLSLAGARVIGLNILFTEPEESSGLTAIRTLKQGFSELNISNSKDGTAFSSTLIEMEENLDNDKKLEDSLLRAQNVVLPFVFNTSQDAQSDEEVELPEFILKNSLDAETEGEPMYFPPSAYSVLYPVEKIGGASLASGHLNRFPGRFRDGIDRWESLLIEYNGSFYPSFALAVASKYAGKENSAPGVDMQGGTVNVGSSFITTDSGMGILINYYSYYDSDVLQDRKNAFPMYSFFDVYNDKINPSVFKGKIVLLGITDIGLGDTAPTPVSPLFSAVEREATVIENILSNSTIIEPWWGSPFTLLVLIIFGASTTVIFSRLKSKTGSIVCALLFVSYIVFAFLMFRSSSLWVGVTYPALFLVVNYLAITSRRFWFTERAKEEAEVEGDEANKLLGLTFQSKGMLEMAYEKFKRLPVDEEMKGVLYNLGLDFEKKRMWAQSLSVYERIKDKKYKDVSQRIERLGGYTSGVGTPVISLKGDNMTIMAGSGGGEKPVLGRYEITAELGRGAMGVVYSGKDPKINRVVAIKTLNFDEVEEKLVPQLKERFFREAHSAGALNHPNIITIFDCGEDANVAYIAMEFIDGKTLESWADKEKLAPIKDVLQTVQKVADALDYAHTHGIVHRDIKPANIMLTKKGEIKVTDFGIARIQSSSHTKTGAVLGTPSYMSPEQIAGKKVDGKSDIFSLGVVLYELLTGERPFKGDSIATIMYNITNSPPPPMTEHNPKLPQFCQQLADKALEKDPEKRFKSAGEFANAIKWCLNKYGNTI